MSALGTHTLNTNIGAAKAAPMSDLSVSGCAIRLAAETKFTDARDCFSWLYNYAAEPLIRSRISREPIVNFVQALTLSEDFQRHKTEAWDNWVKTPASDVQPRHKLYISPIFDEVDRCFARLLPHLSDPNVSAFKTVMIRWMAVRPDKFIVYFHGEAARSEWAAKIAPIIENITANPTPFTHSLSQSGLLSMAVDPVSETPESWRSETLRQMAGWIVEAQENHHAPNQIVGEIYAGLAAQEIDFGSWC